MERCSSRKRGSLPAHRRTQLPGSVDRDRRRTTRRHQSPVARAHRTDPRAGPQLWLASTFRIPKTCPECWKPWSHSMQTGEPLDLEHRIRTADGSVRWMHTRAKPRRDAEGKIIRWYGNTEDIHERKTSKKLSAAALQQLGAVITASPLPIVALKNTGEITLWNPSAERVLWMDRRGSYRPASAVHPAGETRRTS